MLLACYGYFFSAHDAAADVRATALLVGSGNLLEIISKPPAQQYLLQATQTKYEQNTSWRVLLGFRWEPSQKMWYKQCATAEDLSRAYDELCALKLICATRVLTLVGSQRFDSRYLQQLGQPWPAK
jgi:hypothetical protein